MKKLLSAMALLCALPIFAANPSFDDFRGTGGVIVTSNKTTFKITIDGSGISSPTGGVSAAVATNIANASSLAATNPIPNLASNIAQQASLNSTNPFPLLITNVANQAALNATNPIPNLASNIAQQASLNATNPIPNLASNIANQAALNATNPIPLLTTNIANAASSNGVRVAAGSNVTVTTNSSSGAMVYTVASTGGGTGIAVQNGAGNATTLTNPVFVGTATGTGGTATAWSLNLITGQTNAPFTILNTNGAVLYYVDTNGAYVAKNLNSPTNTPSDGYVLTATGTGGDAAWKVAGGVSATNAVSTVMSNGVIIATGVTNLNFSGTTKITNASGNVSIDITPGAGSQTPIAQDVNMAAFSFTNGLKLTLGAGPAESGTQGPSMLWYGTNSSAQVVIWRMRNTNADFHIDSSVNGAAYANDISFASASSKVSATTFSGNNFVVPAKSQIQSSSDGLLTMLNNAGTDFTRLHFGGTTATFPGIGRSGAGFILSGADGTFNSTNSLTIPGSLNVSNTVTLGSTIAGNGSLLTNLNANSVTGGVTLAASTGIALSSSGGTNFISTTNIPLVSLATYTGSGSVVASNAPVISGAALIGTTIISQLTVTNATIYEDTATLQIIHFSDTTNAIEQWQVRPRPNGTPNVMASMETNGVFIAVGASISGTVTSATMNATSGNITGTETNAIMQSGIVGLLTGGSAAWLKGAPTNTVTVTNLFGLVRMATAANLVWDANQSHNWTVTNRVAAATTIVITNDASGQTISGFLLGEVSGGTSRVITLQPPVGEIVANEDTYGTALSTSYAPTLTNGNFMEISDSIRFMNGTNVHFIVTRQGSF